jgi:hypothetical protein
VRNIIDLVNIGPLLKELFHGQDVMIAITNMEETLFYVQGETINLGGAG